MKLKQKQEDIIPYCARPYPIPIAQQAIVKSEIQRLLNLDIIEKTSDSVYAAPAFPIPKSNNQICLVIDYWKLNQYLERKLHIFFRIDTIINEVALNKLQIFSSLDLMMGYHTLMIKEEYHYLTMFALLWGKYRFKKLPFELSTVSDIFQTVMYKLLGDLEFVKVYLDDILILSATPQEHIQHLQIVISQINAAGLTINVGKSQFFKTRIEYLGFILSEKGF